MQQATPPRLRRISQVAALIGIMMLAGCANQPPEDLAAGGIFDPFEAGNRQIHAFNRELDRELVRRAARGYSRTTPNDIESAILRFSVNSSVPRNVVNSALQLDMRSAIQDSARFLVNVAMGLGGLFDTATELGMPPPRRTDFGETLHVWGAQEGPFVMLPLIGPTTRRDAYGIVFDVFTNPLRYVFPSPWNYVSAGTAAAAGLTRRIRFSNTIDQIFYESADSYAQARSAFLQNRRFQLGQTGGTGFDDPYENDGPTAVMEDPYDQ